MKETTIGFSEGSLNMRSKEMEQALNLNNTNVIHIDAVSEFSTMAHVYCSLPFSIQKRKIEEYRKDARKIIDKLSKEFNAIGVENILAAMVIEMVGNNYSGKENK